MTRDSSVKIAAWAIPILLGGLIAIGAARVQLSGKEDVADHRLDIVQLQGTHQRDVARLDAVTAQTAIRDSASRADMVRLLRLLVCDHHPTEDICRP